MSDELYLTLRRNNSSSTQREMKFIIQSFHAGACELFIIFLFVRSFIHSSRWDNVYYYHYVIVYVHYIITYVAYLT